MKVKRIDDLYVVFNGTKFKKDRRSGYYWSLKHPRKSLHLTVYEFHGGVRPSGYELHHKDFDKENNDIPNIDCLPIKEHKRIHNENKKEIHSSGHYNSENIRKAQEANAKWKRTEGYKKWLEDTFLERQEMGRKSISAKSKIELVCDICGEKFMTYTVKTRKLNICSNKCHAQQRRNSGKDDVKKKCLICNKEFISNKYQKIETCSMHCRAVLGYSRRG